MTTLKCDNPERTTAICMSLEMSAHFLSGHNHHHMEPYNCVQEKYMPISRMDTNESGTLS